MDNEYLYKLGVDASDLDAAITTTVSIIGELDNLLGQKMPRSTASFVGGLEKARTAMSGVATDSGKVVDGINAQSGAMERGAKAANEQVAANQKLIQSYREAAVAGTSSGVGTSNQANSALLNTQSVTGIGNRAAQQQYSEQAAKAELAAMRAYYNEEEQLHQGMQDAILASQNAAEARRVASAQAQAKAIETASAQTAQRRIADEQRVTAELEALQNKQVARFESMQKQFASEQAAYNQGNTARYGTAVGDNLQAGTASARNTAARNTGGASSSRSIGAQGGYQEEASQQTLSAMASYYAAQDKAGKATQALTVAQNAQTSNLPRLRYALYDVSMALGIAGTALTSVGGAVAQTTVEYQQLFAQVERTSSLKSPAALSSLKADLVGITEEMPATFADVTQIATLGNQLNIPAAALVNFTKSVTEFSAESNVSVEASATAFGRLGEILGTTDYHQIGDEIAYLGVNAVATESDIIKVAQQIAVTTTSYGLNEKQTLALATAYASLGVKAESARGTTSRAFSDISTAVATGGTKLEEIARVSGVSAEAFAQQWKTDANGAFISFVTGLGKSGSNAKAILAELGITAQRDITSLSLLGQNVPVLTKANKDATESAGYMDQAYLKVSGTVQSQLTIAGNKVQSIFNDIGTSAGGPIAGIVAGLNDVLSIVDAITKDPVAAGGLAITVGIVTATGAALLAIAAFAAFRANTLAIGTAIDQLGLKNAGLKGTYDILFKGKLADTAATKAQREETERLVLAEKAEAEQGLAVAGVVENDTRQRIANTAAKVEGGAASTRAAGGVAALGAAEGAAGASGAGLLGVLGGPVGIAATLLLVIPLLPSIAAGFADWADKARGASVTTDQLTQSIKGLANSGSKMAADQVKNALSYGGSFDYTVGNSTAVNPATGAQYNAGVTKQFTGARAYYNQQQGYASNRGSQAGVGTTDSYASKFGEQVKTVDTTLAAFASAKDYDNLSVGLGKYLSVLKSAGVPQKALEGFLTQTASALGATKGQTLEQAIATAKAGVASDGAAKKQGAYTEALSQYLDKAFNASTKTDAVSEALSKLGKDFLTSGADSASGSTQMQAAIKAIVDEAGSAPKARDQLEGLYQQLVKMGLATPAQLSGLQSVIESYGGSAEAAGAAVPGIESLAKGYNDAAEAANKSAAASEKQQARTAMDYGSDLSSTFASALTYQYGLQDSTDKVTSGWQSIKDNAEEARKSIAGIKADLLSLNADKSQAEYDVKIASMYGDAIGEAKAKANLAKANQSIAGKNDDLDKAKDDSSTKLTGNSGGAIANRAALEQQIQGYQGYITSLAESGASQKDIQAAVSSSRAEFVKQATQLGLSRKEVDKYATSFDGITKIVKAIPKNLTTKVSLNADPAVKAIADYKAKLQDAQKTAAKKTTLPAPTVNPVDGPAKLGVQIGKDIENGLGTIITPERQKNLITFLGGTFGAGALPSQVGTPAYNVQGTPLAPGFVDGGWTGSGGMYDVKGAVHAQEFVLNRRGAQMLPMADLLAMNQGRAPQSTSPTIVIGGGGSKGGLSVADRMFLAQVLAAKPAIQLSAHQFGKAIDGANQAAGMRGAG